MEYTEVISTMNVYLNKAGQVCCKWLEPRLKQIDPQNWWKTTVCANLSELQLQKVEQNNVTTLGRLDLQALLCVLKRNLYPLGNYEYFTDYRLMKDAIRQMFEVRNDWAHTTVEVYPLDVIKLDLTRYINFMELFNGAKADIDQAKEFRATVIEPTHANPLRIKEPSDRPQKQAEERVAPQPVKVMADPFALGIKVVRKSNPAVMGVICGISGSGDAKEYQVMFMDSGLGTFYADQLLLADAAPERFNVSIDELKILLTAQQLCNPTNDQLYSLNAARVDFVPYQFRPALKMIHSERPRILVADSVGVGKTIEAGLILRELQARDEDFESVLIICPKPLVAEHMMADLYAEIREQHKRDYGSKFEEWAPRILVDQYSDRTHFIFELIQNAEDAGATHVTFSLYPNRLVLCHNGKPFTEADIRGICGIRSTKDELESGKIGRFGIGFKSVYAYTRTPVIYSGQYSFRIQNLILPYAEKNESVGNDTILILPFDGNVSAEDAYEEIRKALEKYISSDVLFALKNIRSINCKIDQDGGEWLVNRENHPISSIVDRVLLSQKGKETKELLTFHTQDRQPVLIGYELKQGENGHEKIVPAGQHYLYVYFPTAVETHQAFYIHVPFSTTPARDNVRHNEINRLLAERLNELFAKSVRWLLENGYVTLKFLNDVYPLTDTCKEENLQGLHHMGRKLFQEGVEILPTDAGGYCAVKDAMLPYAKNIAENITQEILKKEYGKEICWVQADICLSAYVRLWVYLVQSFGIKVLRWKDVLPKLTTDILEEQPDEWLLNLMEVINSTCTGNMRSKEKVDARSIPFVRLQDGTQICARYDGVAQVYLNNPISCKNKIKNTILQDRRGYDFYVAALDIEEYNAVQELKDDVICFYGDNSEDTDIPFEDNLEHFLVIERALKENDNDVRRILKNIPIVFAYNGEWKKPDECYLTNKMIDRPQYESRLLSRLDIQWISDKYIEYITPDVFQKIGCNTTLKSIQVDKKSYLLRLSLHDKDLYAQAIDKIFSKLYTEILEPETWNWAFSVEHIKDLVTEVSLSESIDIVDFLNEIVDKHPLYGKMRGARDRNYSGKSVATLEKIPSALAIELESENWLYDKDGRLKPIAELKASDLNADYNGHGEKLFSQLPFIPENEAVEAAIQTVDAPYQDFVSTMLKKPDELRWMFEAYQKFQRKKKKEEAAPESLIGLLEKQSSVQTEIETERTPDEDELGEYGAVQNLKHREKKLDESFQEGLEGQKTVTPRLRYTCSESNQEEKAFLKAQYFGKCQICGKQILQANGKVYFEACNILPTDVVPARYKQSISEGWNSLCLCPNCAAEFKFGKKNLSGLISMIQNYHVKERDENLIVCDIEMQGEKRSIKYTGKHFLALQRAVSFYETDMNSSTK